MTPASQSTSEVVRAALYARVSLEIQAEQGHSIAAQLTEMRQYAAGRGWEVVAEFVDAGYTGTDMHRPGLQALCEAVRHHECDVVLVHELSRLSRRQYDTFELFELFGKHNVGFASVKDPDFDLSSATNRLFLAIIAALNQYYVDLLKMHTQKGKHQRIRDGLYNASIPPYGYRHMGDSRTPPEIVPEEAEVVRLIFERYATGRYSYQDLADLLNAQGYHTHTGLHFSKDTIADMLRNPFYMGKVVYKQRQRTQGAGDIYEGLHQPIIAPGLWESCHQIRARHHSASRPFQPQVRPYMLGQLLRCHACGRRLRAQNTTSGRYYREMSNARGFYDCPYAQKGARVESLHEQMSVIVNQIHLPADWQAELAGLLGEDEELSAAQQQRERLEAERRRLKRAWVRGDFEEDAEVYQEELERIRRELARIPTEDELAQLQVAAQQVTALQEIWDEAEEADQRDLLHLMFRRIVADVTQGRLLLLYPTAPFIPLLRTVPLLQERELGVFAPVWPPELAERLPYAQMPPLTALPVVPASLPFVPAWPGEALAGVRRISPALSAALKLRSQAGLAGGRAVVVPHAGLEPVLLDRRKWPEVELLTQSWAAALAQPAGSLSYLDSTLEVQGYPERDTLFQQVAAVLAEQGTWHWYEVLPVAMPAHWLFGVFPALWSYAEGLSWSSQQIFMQLMEVGLPATLQERTYYQAVSLGAALEVVRQRTGWLKLLPDAEYEQGVAQLEGRAAAEGPTTLLGSEFTLVEVVAVKGGAPQQKKRGKQAGAVQDA